MLRMFALATVLAAASCLSVHDQLSKTYLTPAEPWLVEPMEFGLRAERFEIEVGNGSMVGFFLPGNAEGETVLMFHNSTDNVSMLHPYYRFLADAGLNVCVFDYRGFGKSQGKPAIRSVFYDAPKVVDWLCERPDVDAEKIAFYGIGMGSVAALYTAIRKDCAALVLENVPSPRDKLAREGADGDGGQGNVSAAWLEWAGLPEGTEPRENAAQLSMPSLWISGALEPAAERVATLAAYFEMGGSKQLWVLPETAAAPNSMMTFDGEYQRVVGTFLKSALTGRPELVSVDWDRREDATGGGSWWDVHLGRMTGTGDAWAVQVCALDTEGMPVFENSWLDGDHTDVRMRLRQEPGVIGAMRLVEVESTQDGSFRRKSTPLSRAGEWYEQHAEQIDVMRNDEPDLETARRLAALIRTREQVEPLPAALEAQLADVYALIGIAMSASTDAEDKAKGLVWLQRAQSAVPGLPAAHFWPGRPATYGYPQRAAVNRAQRILQQGQRAPRRQPE